MGLSQQFDSNAISNQVKLFQQRLEQATIYLLKYLGEELAKYAKDMHNYTDRTGNLTNSIGYAVVQNTKVIYSEFTQPGEGATKALNVAMQMAQTLPNSFSLVVVAGMDYAAYVEAKGYNVLLPAELKAKKDFPIAMQTLMDKATKKATEIFGI